MRETHLVTGATGFVGSALVLELLRSTDARVLCLVRPHGDAESAQRRLFQVLQEVARAFGMPEVAGRIAQRCRAVPADLRLEHCGVEPEQLGPVSEVWHSAASLRFGEEHREELIEQNVNGTRRVLALCAPLAPRAFNYISTAYVAGRRTGRILEVLPEPATAVNNPYEASKIQAELLVAASGLEYRLLRPSVVIGHSKTHAVINPSGVYGYARAIAQLQRVLARRGELAVAQTLEIRGDPSAPLNLIPVDAVVSSAVRISQSASRARVFHLTNAEPPPVGLIVSETSGLLGLAGPRMTPAPRLDLPYAEPLNQRIRLYLDYFDTPKEFDLAHTDAVVGREASRWPLDAQGLRRYLGWYLENRRAG